MYRSIALTTLVHDDGSTTDGYHQHAPTLADHLIVEVNSDDGVRPDPLRLIVEFLQRDLASLVQLLLVGCRTASHRNGASASRVRRFALR